MKNQEVVYLCNALDDVTKADRMITTDSPAATNKVVSLCCALQKTGLDVAILSMGRGRQRARWAWFSSAFRDINGIMVVYASFWDAPVITHLVTAFSLLYLFVKMPGKHRKVVVAYNRLWHYIPLLFFARLIRVRCYLDLEDGIIGKPGLPGRFLVRFFDWACDQGSLLACSALSAQVKSHRNYVCYGVATSAEPKEKNWTGGSLNILWGGTLARDMGAKLFIDAICLLISDYPAIKGQISLIVTGKGAMEEEIGEFAAGEAAGWVKYLGEVSSLEFEKVRGESHIGLSLNLPSSGLHETVFPSKVIDLAANGLLVISTNTSDVAKMFSSHDAVILADDSPECLAGALCWAVKHREEVALMAKRGRSAVLHCCAPELVGRDLASFLIGEIC